MTFVWLGIAYLGTLCLDGDMSETPAQILAKRWGKKLAAERRAVNLSQTAFAALIQRDQSWVSRYERGRGNWTLEVMVLFAAGLNTPPERIFEFPQGMEAMERFRLGIAA